VPSNLLRNTRRLTKILQQGAGEAVSFSDVAKVFSDVLTANVYVLNTRGKLLGYALREDYECDILSRYVRAGRFPSEYNSQLLAADQPMINLQESTSCVFDDAPCEFADKLTTMVPVVGRGQRLGTLLLARFDEPLDDGELALAEFGATVLAMEILRAKSEELEAEARERAVVEMAVDALSFSELEAIEHIMRELGDETEGLLVASKVADQAGITRSVIVNALRKLESAGVIESRSLGMKGTFIRILNDKLLEQVAKRHR
jgi:transcriptional pleiotropic repressor